MMYDLKIYDLKDDISIKDDTSLHHTFCLSQVK